MHPTSSNGSGPAGYDGSQSACAVPAPANSAAGAITAAAATPNAVASSFRLVPPGPSLDPTLFPLEPLQDQINDQFMYPPQTTIEPPAGNEMTPEQFRAYEEFRHTGEFFRCPGCDEEPPPDLGQMPEIQWAP